MEISRNVIRSVSVLLEPYQIDFVKLLALQRKDTDRQENGVKMQWMSLPEAMAYAKVSRWTIRRWIDSGKIKGTKLSDSRCGKVLVCFKSLEAFLESRRMKISDQVQSEVKNG
ncbi:MAG: helix-turn-helix domain-containing protein [Crenarchaeota archaeon]|nr:helix-turn-helix domain-containing protein [Thermoproteota archaeon]